MGGRDTETRFGTTPPESYVEGTSTRTSRVYRRPLPVTSVHSEPGRVVPLVHRTTCRSVLTISSGDFSHTRPDNPSYILGVKNNSRPTSYGGSRRVVLVVVVVVSTKGSGRPRTLQRLRVFRLTWTDRSGVTPGEEKREGVNTEDTQGPLGLFRNCVEFGGSEPFPRTSGSSNSPSHMGRHKTLGLSCPSTRNTGGRKPLFLLKNYRKFDFYLRLPLYSRFSDTRATTVCRSTGVVGLQNEKQIEKG